MHSGGEGGEGCPEGFTTFYRPDEMTKEGNERRSLFGVSK